MSFITTNAKIVSAAITALADIGDIDVRQQEVLWVSFTVATANLSQFVVQFQVGGRDAAFFTVASAAADYTTPSGPVEGASGDLTTAASGATVYWLRINVKGVGVVKLRAAGTASVITVRTGAQ